MESFVIYGCVIKSRSLSPAATTIHNQGGGGVRTEELTWNIPNWDTDHRLTATAYYWLCRRSVSVLSIDPRLEHVIRRSNLSWTWWNVQKTGREIKVLITPYIITWSIFISRKWSVMTMWLNLMLGSWRIDKMLTTTRIFQQRSQ